MAENVHAGHVQHMMRLREQLGKYRTLANEVSSAFVPLEPEEQAKLRSLLSDLIRKTEEEQDRLFYLIVNKIRDNK